MDSDENWVTLLAYGVLKKCFLGYFLVAYVYYYGFDI